MGESVHTQMRRHADTQTSARERIGEDGLFKDDVVMTPYMIIYVYICTHTLHDYLCTHIIYMDDGCSQMML